MSTTTKTLTIDIISDIVCPWCVVGYKRLQTALSGYPDVAFEIHWHPFELNPNMPEEGQNMGEHIVEKYGSTPEQSAENRRHLEEIGREVGFEINYGEGSRIVNTFRGHQLMHWAGTLGLEQQSSLQLALFEAYFTHGKNVNDPAVLGDAVAQAGLDRDEAARVLADGRYAEDVREEEMTWMGQGVRSVPTFIIGDQYAMSGAREPSEIREVLGRIFGEGPKTSS